MKLHEINSLERKGLLLESAKMHLHLYRSEMDENIRGIHTASLRRIYSKLSREHRSQLLASGSDFLGIPGLLDILANSTPAQASSSPLVSIVIPCYNCENFLNATIDSVLRQSYTNFECILIDDFSTDNTLQIARDAKAKDKRFRLYQHRANGGLSASRNSGIRLAKGRFVCFLDSDDLLSANSIRNRVQELSRYANEQMVAGVFDFSQTVAEDFAGEITDTVTKYDGDLVDFISAQGHCPFNANQPMLKRSVLVKMGGFPENYPQAEDWRLWSKMLRCGYLFVPVKRIGSGYRQSRGSMIRRAPLLHLEKSSGNFYRSHLPVSGEKDKLELRYESIFESAPYFERELGFYLAQSSFIPRVFNFVGIELAKSAAGTEELSLSSIRETVMGAVPDLHKVASNYTFANMLGWMQNGYKRYLGVSELTQDQNTRSRVDGHRVLCELFEDFDVAFFGNAKRVVSRRMLVSREVEIVDILFFPHKAYHTRSFALLIPLLKERGLTFRFVNSSVPYRNEMAYDANLSEYFVSYNEFVLSRLGARSIVCMNDWDTVVRPVVQAANHCSIPTIGIVEGVQDFHDADTGRKRNAYREVSNVFLPGEFDRKYFTESPQTLWVTGVQRLDGLEPWRKRRSERTIDVSRPRRVVVNVNFSYNVMTDRRIQWLTEIREACSTVGFEMIVSQHPQDDGDLSAFNTSREPLYDLLVDADFFISRFSGAILESMIIGCPVIYYNSHGELVDKFHNSLGAYAVANTLPELTDALQSPRSDADRIAEFLHQHCDIDAADISNSSVSKTVAAIERVILTSHVTSAQHTQFKTRLGGVQP
ncbi:MAG: glycosyltransferase [Pseudomonadota bacterium]